jgi:peptidoglycan hydrolase CwlO-like protein
MTDTILKYIQPVMLVIIFIFIVFSSCNNNENTEKNFRRSVKLEQKIDSLSFAVTAIDEKLLPVETAIETSNKQITQNKIKYEKQKKNITSKPADTVYNWTKLELRKRTK